MPRSKQILNNCQLRCEDYFWQLCWCLVTQDFEKLFKYLPESNRKKFNENMWSKYASGRQSLLHFYLQN